MAQMKVSFIQNDCVEYPNKELCQEINQKLKIVLDSLDEILDYTYIEYHETLDKSNLILASFIFEKREYSKDTCFKFILTDAYTNLELSHFCTTPASIFPHIWDGMIMNSIQDMLAVRTLSYLSIKKQKYFEDVLLFFEFDKVDFNIKLPKDIRKEIYILVHNICVQEQIQFKKSFNFLSKYSGSKKINKKDNTELYVAFEPVENDEHSCKVIFYLDGEGLIDMYPYGNHKIPKEIILNLKRIKKQDYTELLDKLYTIGSWISVNE